MPRPVGAQSSTVALTPAAAAQLHEYEAHRVQGCIQYTRAQLAAMECTQLTLVPGDVLYMPKGIVHYATAHAEGISTHVTVGLHREGALWKQVWPGVLAAALADVVPSDDALQAAVRDVLLRAQNASEGTAEGVRWLSPVPLWAAGRWARAQGGGQCVWNGGVMARIELIGEE